MGSPFLAPGPLAPGRTPRWKGSRAMAPACGRSCWRREPIFRWGLSARRAASSCSASSFKPDVLRLEREAEKEKSC